MTMTTTLVVIATVVAVSTAAMSTAVSSSAAVASTTTIPATAVAATAAAVSSSGSTISTVIASIFTTTSPARIATPFSSAATGTRGPNGDAIGGDGSVTGGGENQHVSAASAGNPEIIELGSAIAIRDSGGGSGQETAAGCDRCRHADAASSKVVTVGVLYLDCRLAVEPDAGCS